MVASYEKVDRSFVTIQRSLIERSVGTTRSSGNITRSRVTKSARAGISNFSSDLSIQSTVLNCNAIHLDGEGDDFTFSDGGENRCQCDAQSTPCKVLSANLKPPEPF